MKARSMQDQLPTDTAGWLAAALPTLAKLVPAGLGALIMVAIDPPASRRELFWRLAAAGMCSMFLGDIAMSWLHSLSWLAFIDPERHAHQAGVNFIVGGSGWFVLGGLGVVLKRVRANPLAAVFCLRCGREGHTSDECPRPIPPSEAR